MTSSLTVEPAGRIETVDLGDPEPQVRAHLWAGTVTLCAILALAVGGTLWGERVERRSFESLFPLLSDSKAYDANDRTSPSYIEHLKNQGVALQRQAFARSDLLPLYGSSELMKRIPDKSSLFYQHFPSGFGVFPVGKAGATPLIMVQKLAALGDVTAGKRVAISLSPSWFFVNDPPARYYNGNFSRQQAFSSLLNPRLSFGFKKDLSRQLLLHPTTLQHDSLLLFLTQHLARGGHTDRMLFFLTLPLAELQRSLYDAQDHFEVALYVQMHPRHSNARGLEKKPATLDWDRLITDASSLPNPAVDIDSDSSALELSSIGSDQGFRETFENAPEWVNLELLLRGLHEMGVKTLVLCMPPNGVYFEKGGITKESLDLFAARIRTIALRSGALVEAFEDHEEDVSFLVDHHDHMSAKGWMYYNRALDEFFHADPAELERQFEKGHRKRQRLTLGHS